jgi:hypothetical protein
MLQFPKFSNRRISKLSGYNYRCNFVRDKESEVETLQTNKISKRTTLNNSRGANKASCGVD